MASVSAVGAVIAYARGDSDIIATVMDRETDFPEGRGRDENKEKMGGRERGE